MELSSSSDNACDIHSIQWHSCQVGEKTNEPMLAAEITLFFSFFRAVVDGRCHKYSQFDAWIAQQMVSISDAVLSGGLCTGMCEC